MYKDKILDGLADSANVAQFVSYGPDGAQRFSRVYGHEANKKFDSMREGIAAILNASPEHSVNVRSFLPDSPQGNAFHYGITSADTAVEIASKLSAEGFYTIVNETVDVNDGGVSGVVYGGCVEFAPGVIPRFVEKASDEPVPALPIAEAVEMLSTVYGVPVNIDFYELQRVEFSVHPKARGWKHEHVIVWELGEDGGLVQPFYSWPNSFSRLIGDKTYGLMMANILGFAVPRTTVYPRNTKIPPFSFGEPTGNNGVWTRTAPRVQEPGEYTTVRGWSDPFVMMDSDDPENVALAACLVQDEVASMFSGAVLTGADGSPIIEAVHGFGDGFMVGENAPVETIPAKIIDDVTTIHAKLCELLGAARFEWAHDGRRAWVLQLHKGQSESCGRIIYPGNASDWVDFRPEAGLAVLRSLVADAIKTKSGVRVLGNVGLSSHVCDVLRKAKVPSVMGSKEHTNE